MPTLKKCTLRCLALLVGTLSLAPASQSLAQAPASLDGDGATLYAARCAVCHGEHREGILPAFPPLLGLSRQMTEVQVEDTIHKGKGRMPAFPDLSADQAGQIAHFLLSASSAAPSATKSVTTSSGGQLDAGAQLFQQNCAFCHGRDASGGESGPDLTRSKLVHSDKGGDQIGVVVRVGRQEGDKKMPAFLFSDLEVHSLANFIHAAELSAAAKGGTRKGVDPSDLQTGDVAAGKRYFNGTGTCSSCHSPTGDLAGVATRHQGLDLEERMLYPRNVKRAVNVTLASGERISGTLAYKDEFVIAMRDGNGTYHSWPVTSVTFKIDSFVEAHAALLPKYTDKDIHNLMAYIQTLR